MITLGAFMIILGFVLIIAGIMFAIRSAQKRMNEQKEDANSLYNKKPIDMTYGEIRSLQQSEFKLAIKTSLYAVLGSFFGTLLLVGGILVIVFNAV